MKRLAIYCADVGSIAQGNFGWAGEEWPAGQIERHRGTGDEIDELVGAVTSDLKAGVPVALGFECPLFVPVPADALRLGRARPGEGTRPWSAAAGAGALATGLVQGAWVLSELRTRRPADRAYLDWRAFERAEAGLLLWEAFVTDTAKAGTHVDDATAAVAQFAAALPDPEQEVSVGAERPLSLVGAAAIWAGWSEDPGLLEAPCLVVKAAAAPG